MKKLSMLFAALLLAGGGAMFTGCSDNDDPAPAGGSELKLTDADGNEITSVEISSDGSEQARVYVKTDGAWDMTLGTQDWCEATKGATRITLSADANDTGEERSTTLTVTSGELQATVTVTQPAGTRLYVGTYESFIGTWTLKALQLMSEAGEYGTYTLTIEAGNDVTIPSNNGDETFKGYKVKGWSASNIGQEFAALGIFGVEETQDGTDLGVFALISYDEIGEYTVDGKKEMFDFSGMAVDMSTGNIYGLSETTLGVHYIILIAAFDSEDGNSLIWQPTAVNLDETTQIPVISGVYKYDTADGWLTIDDADMFGAAGFKNTTCIRVGGTSSVHANLSARPVAKQLNAHMFSTVQPKLTLISK